jgi:23S rRNA (cytidine2498-2'-O)-methyltransferase
MTQFYFTLTNPEVDSLFKAEVLLRYPQLRMSYNRPGFYTFKSEVDISYQPQFARVSGISLGKYKFDQLNFSRAWAWKYSDELELPSTLKEISDKTIYKIGEKVTLIMMLAQDEFWVGEYVLRSHHFQTPGEVSSILQMQTPSRAYYKIAEAFESFDLPFSDDEIVLELGSAPGGASQFLLNQGMKVVGVDPADMDEMILKNKNFKHLRRAFETIESVDIPWEIDWIVSDVNLPPAVVLGQVHRFLKFLNPRGVVLTLKMNEAKYLNLLDKFVQDFRRQGFKKVELKYLPSHRKELVLIALHS